MTEQKIMELLRNAYQWGRDNGSNRSEKNFNDFLQTEAAREALSIANVSARYSLKDMEQIFFAGYFHQPIKNDDTEDGLDSAFKAVIDRHNSNVR